MKKPGWQAKQWDERLKQRMQHEPSFEAAAWEDMVARLDAAMPQSFPINHHTDTEATNAPRQRRRIAPFWYAVAASISGLLIISGLWWGLRHTTVGQANEQPGLTKTEISNNAGEARGKGALAATEKSNGDIARKEGEPATEAVPGAGGVTVPSAGQQGNIDITSEQTNSGRRGAVANNPSDAAEKSANVAPGIAEGGQHKAANRQVSGGEAVRNSGAGNSTVMSSRNQQQTEQPLQEAPVGQTAKASEGQGLNSSRKALAESRSLPGKATAGGLVWLDKIPYQHSNPAISFGEPRALPVDPDTAVAAEETVVARERKKPSGHRWSLALAAAPDMSQVGSLSTTKTGWGGGLLLGYRLGNRLRLQAGAIYTEKNYESYESFVPYEGMGNYPDPDYIDASCKVLDLPLNVQYQFLQGKRFRWYASAGMSSYLMLSEYYNFQYHYYNYEYTYKNENKHWLGVVNAGVGFETPLFNRIKLQVEPYYKLPINGVGAGQIRLTSFGALLQLRYDL